MAQGKQAKTLTDSQIARMLREVENSRYPLRDRVMVLLSVRAGLRAKEIALATWGMVLDADGNVGDALELHDKASKGAKGGREIPLHPAPNLRYARDGRWLPGLPIAGLALSFGDHVRPRAPIGPKRISAR
jgi:integrase